jgi:hypothetical protein
MNRKGCGRKRSWSYLPGRAEKMIKILNSSVFWVITTYQSHLHVILLTKMDDPVKIWIRHLSTRLMLKHTHTVPSRCWLKLLWGRIVCEVGITTRPRARRVGIRIAGGQAIFSFPHTSRATLAGTQLPIQWVLFRPGNKEAGALSWPPIFNWCRV